MYNLPRTYNNCNTTVDSSEYTKKLSSTLSSCTACTIDNTNCCQVNADAIQDISAHLVIVDASINYLFTVGDLSSVIVLINDISQNVYDNSQSIIELNNEVDDLSGVFHDLSATVLDLSSTVHDLSGEIYSLPGVVTDLSAVVLDLSGDFNNHLIAFIDLSGVVADLSTVVFDLSGDFNTLNTAFTDLSGVVADLSSNKVSKSGDTMIGNLTISKSTPQLVLNDTTSSNNSSINVDSNGLMLNVNSSEVLKLSGPNATGSNPFITLRNTFGTSSRMRFLNPNDVNDVFDIGIHNSTLGNERFIDHNGYQLGIYGSGTKAFNGGSTIFNTDILLNHGLTLNAATAPASTTNKLYRVDSDVYWNGQKLSVWDTSGTSLVIDPSYDNIIIPGSTTQLGVDHTTKTAYLETDLSNIKFNVQGNNAITIDNSSIDLSGTVNFSDILTAKQGLKISTYTPGTTTSTLYTPNGTDLYWNGSALGTDLSSIVYDLSSTVYDLSAVVIDLSSTVYDLSGVVNTKANKAGDTFTGLVTMNQGLKLSSYTPGTATSTLYTPNGTDLFWNNLPVSLWEINGSDITLKGPPSFYPLMKVDDTFIVDRSPSGNSPVLKIHNPNSATDSSVEMYQPNVSVSSSKILRIGMLSTGNAFINSDDAIINNISGNPILEISANTVSFNKSLLLNNYTPASTSSQLYTPNGTDLYWNGSALGSGGGGGGDITDLSAVVQDLSAVVLDLSAAVLDLSGDFNTHLTAFTDLSGVVADLSSNKVSKSGDTMTGDLNISGLTLGKSGNAYVNATGTSLLTLSADDEIRLDFGSNNYIRFIDDVSTSGHLRALSSNTPLVIDSARDGGYFPRIKWNGGTLDQYAYDKIDFRNNYPEVLVFSISGDTIQNYKEARFDNALLINNYTPSTTTSRLYTPNGTDLYWNGLLINTNSNYLPLTGGTLTGPLSVSYNSSSSPMLTLIKTNQASSSNLYIQNTYFGKSLNFGVLQKSIYYGSNYENILDTSGLFAITNTHTNSYYEFDNVLKLGGSNNALYFSNVFTGTPTSSTLYLKDISNNLGWGTKTILDSSNWPEYNYFDVSGTSLVLDTSYDSIIIPGSTTKLGVDHTTNKAYLETDLSSIDFKINENDVITINDNSTNIYKPVTVSHDNASLTLYSPTGNYTSNIIQKTDGSLECNHRGSQLWFGSTANDELTLKKRTILRSPPNMDNYFGIEEVSSGYFAYLTCFTGNAKGYFKVGSDWNYFYASRQNYGPNIIWSTEATYFKINVIGYNKDGNTISSDRRIKKNIQEIKDDSALQIIKKIEPKTYNYIDLHRQKELVYGFIAQEVAEVLPAAVSIIRDTIPDILKNVSISGDIITFETETELIVGNQVEIRKSTTVNYGEEVTIVSKINSNTYKIETKRELEFTNGFCYGHYVDDFHYLCKDKLLPILWSATQQVIKEQDLLKLKVQTLEIEKDVLTNKTFTLEQDNATLKQDNATLKQDNALLKQQVADMEARLKLIEAKLQI